MTERPTWSEPPEDDLDGHTLDELERYLDAGRTPRDPSIEGSPACRNALAALQRLRDVTRQFVQDAADREPAREDAWVAAVLASISIDARAGRDFPLAAALADDAVVMTEGALRSLVRSTGDRVPGLLIGRVRFEGDLADATAPVAVELTVTVIQGFAIPGAVAELRRAVAAEITRHTARVVERIDVTVHDLQALADESAPEAER